MDGGYLTIGRWRGVPLRMHVLTPLGALLFTGFRLEPGAWLGFLVLIVLHEMGHAAWVMRYGRRVASIDLHAYGGVCRWSGEVTGFQRSVIAWGGVMVQAMVFGLTTCAVALFGRPSGVFLRELVNVLTTTNLWLMVLNLIPLRPLDGAEAWKIVGELRRRGPPSMGGPRGQRDTALSPEEARRIAKIFEDAVRR